MTKNSTLEKGQTIREKISREADDNLDRITETEKQRQLASAKDHGVVKLPPNPSGPPRMTM